MQNPNMPNNLMFFSQQFVGPRCSNGRCRRCSQGGSCGLDMMPQQQGFYFTPEMMALPSAEMMPLPSDEMMAPPSTEMMALPSDEMMALPSDEMMALPLAPAFAVPTIPAAATNPVLEYDAVQLPAPHLSF